MDRRAAGDPRRDAFASGRVPSPLPDGQYRGVVPGYGYFARRWYGKRFDAATQSGTNLWRKGEQVREAGLFRVHVGPALQEPAHEVLRFDYDLADNPFWVRALYAAELVEVDPGCYLGKTYLRFLPFRPLALFFIELRADI